MGMLVCNEVGEVEGVDYEGFYRIYFEGNRKLIDNYEKIYVLKRLFFLVVVWWVDC